MSLIGEYEFPVSINTNGLLLTQDLAKFLVKIKLGSISFSIDAFTKETYKKTRGTYALESVKKAVFRMLEERRSSNYPRIGVSFLMNNTTMHEMNDFVSYWLKYVDVVRVAKMFDDEKKIEGEPFIKVSDNRLPCKEVYNTMSINYKGDVYVCCFDSFSEVFLGNVFEDGLLNVWNGEKVNSIRKKMIAKEFDKIDFCKNCILSREYTFEEKECEGVLIRKSPHVVFYNRVDKIASWSISSYLGENKYKQEVLT
jgi:radical SAM protein with 4Fe4S-binding SPASM domain